MEFGAYLSICLCGKSIVLYEHVHVVLLVANVLYV